MLQVKMETKVRTVFGKGPMRQLRMRDITPANLYSGGNEPVSLQFDTAKLFKDLLFIHGRNAVVTLDVEGDSKGSRNIELKSVSWPKKFDAKEFLTGNFKGDKPFWMGDFKYATAEANTTPRSQLVLPKNSDAGKSAAVKSARESQKHYETGTVPTRDFRGKEREKLNTSLTPQQAANNGYRGGLTELKSIDDVRALLNKSK